MRTKTAGGQRGISRRRAAEADLTTFTRFAASPLIECCYALAHLCEQHPTRALHAAWTEAARRKLSPAFWRSFQMAGAWARIWTVVPDLLDEFDPAQSPERFAGQLSVMGSAEFARRIISGVVHPDALVQQITSGKLSLRAAVAKASPTHREWLLYCGLYPFDAGAPVARMLQLALDDPQQLGEAVGAMLSEFWMTTFATTWRHAQVQYAQSIAEKQRMQIACSPQQFADDLRLRIEIVENRYLQAVRGGYRLPFSRIGTVWMVPSAFNTQHFWHVLSSDGSEHALFPYFDPAIDIGLDAANDRVARRDLEPSLDPAQVFRALADPARYSMMLLLGAMSRTATELAQQLSLSKGTVSHHVHIMREAGLVTQSRERNAVLLRLNSASIERLSTETLKVIDSASRGAIARIRYKQRTGAR